VSNRYFRPLGELLQEFWQSSSGGQTGSGASFGLRTGLLDLDTLLGGLSRASLTVCAATGAAGKSCLALQLARTAAVGQNARVAIFSIQHSGEDAALRLLAAEIGVDLARLQLGLLSEIEERRAMSAVVSLAAMSLYIDDSMPTTVSQIRTKLSRLCAEIGGVDLVVVDQLELLAIDHETASLDKHDVNATALRELARDFELPIVATAGLRFPASASSAVPQLTDICGDGGVEELADVVMFLYREDIYVTREDWETRNFDQPYPEGITKLIVAKHRNGPTGVVHLRFRNHLSRFEDLMVVEEESA
jgi:replicative DNA helicase